MRAVVLFAGLLAVLLAIPCSAATIIVEPDDFANGAAIVVPGVTLTAFDNGGASFGSELTSSIVRSRTALGNPAPTGSRVFGNDSSGFFETGWYTGDHCFRADFADAAIFLSVDLTTDFTGDTDLFRVRIFDSSDTLLDTALGTATSGVTTVSFVRGSADIAYVIIDNDPVTSGDSFMIDHLVIETGAAAVPEPSTLVLLGAGALLLPLVRRRK